MSKIVYQNNILEPTNQHHRASLSKKHPGANKLAPQGRSIEIIKVTLRSQEISTTGPVYQNNTQEPINQHHRAGLPKPYQGGILSTKIASQRQQITTTGSVYQKSKPRANKSAPQGQSINITPPEPINQHHRAGLPKSYQGGRLSTKIASRTQQISIIRSVYQDSKPKAS